MLVAIDPGHGGRDPGAVGFIREVDMTYAWAAVFKTELQKRGFSARLTHERPGRFRKVSLGKRVRTAKKMKADLFISIHADSWETQRPEGAAIFVYSQRSEAFSIAKELISTLGMGVGIHGDGVKTANFYVLRKTSMPAMLFELGFVTNPDDALWLMSNYKRHAWNVAEKLAEIFVERLL